MSARTSLRRALGSRRSWCLALLSVIFIAMGVSALNTPPDEVSPASRRAYAVALTLADFTIWGAVFVTAAVLALIAAVTTHHRLGYVVLMALTVWWAAMLFASWIMVGDGRALVGALQWLALTAVLVTIVGWPDPPQRVIVSRSSMPQDGRL